MRLLLAGVMVAAYGCGNGTPEEECEVGVYPNTCPGDLLCVTGACEDWQGRTYRIEIRDLTFNETPSTGGDWDPFGGAPDPFVEVALDGTTVLTTEIAFDTFTVDAFVATVDVVLQAGSSLYWTAYDSDDGASPAILTCVSDPVTASHLIIPGLCSGGGSSEGNEFTTVITLL